MTDSLAARLAARFRDDAQALRARAASLDARGPAQRGGPDAAASRQMADACDRVGALFADVADDAALPSVGPALERLAAAERSPDARNVYAGAVTRLRQVLGDDDDDDDEEDDDED
jgi:hypothetical protein